MFQSVQVGKVVGSIMEDVLTLIATGYDMIEGAGKFDSGLSGHDCILG